jgi:hypothetical protein
MSAPKIITNYWAKPIPDRQFDWSAWCDGDEPNDNGQMMVGYGRTEAEAIADLRIVACEACGTEGRVLVTVAGQWDPENRGPCPYCDGTGGEIIITQPIEMEDLDEGRAA